LEINILILIIYNARHKLFANGKGLCDGGFYTQRIFKTAIAKLMLAVRASPLLEVHKTYNYVRKRKSTGTCRKV